MDYFSVKGEFFKKLFQIVVVSGFLVIAAASLVWGCSCAPTGSATQAFKANKMVFLGEVVEVREVGDDDHYLNRFEHTIKVEKAWKGVSRDTVIVETEYGGCSGGPIKKGRRLLIYSRGGNDFFGEKKHSGSFDKLKQFFQMPRIKITWCNRTKSADSANLEVLYLDAAVEGRSENEIHQKLPGILSNHKDPRFREEAARILGYESPRPLPKGGIVALLGGLRDSDIKVRKAVANAMLYGKPGTRKEELAPEVVAAFLAEEKMWKEAHDRTLYLEVLRPLAEFVVKFGNRESKLKTIPYLIRELEGDKKGKVIWLLSFLGPDANPAVPALKKLLEKNYQSEFILKTLKNIGTPEALEATRFVKK